MTANFQPIVGTQNNPIPFRTDEGASGFLFGEAAMLLFLLVVVGGGLYWFSRWSGKFPIAQRTKQRMRVIETCRLSPKTRVYLLEVDNKSLLLTDNGQDLCVMNLDKPSNHSHESGGVSNV